MAKKSCISIATIGVLAALTAPAFAQFGVGTIVSDPPVEQATAGIEAELGTTNTTLAGIQTSDAMTAASVTTPGDPGLFQGVNGFLDAQDSLLTSAGASAAVMQVIFPGWMPLQPDNISANATIAQTVLGTYAAAVQVAQNRAADFDAESTYFASIEAANLASTSLLGALQINTEAHLADCAQVQMLSGLVVALITIEALHYTEEFNEKAQLGATEAQMFNFGVSPQ